MTIDYVMQWFPVIERLITVGYVRPNGAAQARTYERLEGSVNTWHYGIGTRGRRLF